MSAAGRDHPDPWSRRGVAALYDLQLLLERPALQVLARSLEIETTDRVLDVGTGTGAMLRELAALPAPPRVAVGIDRSRAMLERVPALPAGWELIEGEGAALPFEPAGFDRVILSYLLHLMEPEQRSKVLAEARRVLKPGGLVGTVTVAPPSGWAARLTWLPMRLAADWPGGVLAGLRPLDPTAELIDAGLRPVRRQRPRGGYPSLCLVAVR